MAEELNFRKRPVVIQAVQWTGENLREVICFTDGPPDARSTHASMKWEDYCDLVKSDGLKIYTLEGKMRADVGDWIIKGVKGEHYPCKPDVFELTYEPARTQLPSQVDEVVEVVERLQMQLVACGVVALANTPESAARARDMHPDYMSASCSDVMRAVDREMHQRAALLDWAVERWHAEVSQRPLVNVNRRSIDDTWRQIIRKLGGDPVDLCGPDHDTLLASAEGVKDE